MKRWLSRTAAPLPAAASAAPPAAADGGTVSVARVATVTATGAGVTGGGRGADSGPAPADPPLPAHHHSVSPTATPPLPPRAAAATDREGASAGTGTCAATTELPLPSAPGAPPVPPSSARLPPSTTAATADRGGVGGATGRPPAAASTAATAVAVAGTAAAAAATAVPPPPRVAAGGSGSRGGDGAAGGDGGDGGGGHRGGAAAATGASGALPPRRVSRSEAAAAADAADAAAPPAAPPPGKTSGVFFGTRFTVADRYRLGSPLGYGAYGVVVSAVDTWTGGQVAIKKVSCCFASAPDAKRMLREVRLGKALRHPCLLSIVDLDAPMSYAEFADLYIISDRMDTDLHKLARSTTPILPIHLSFFMYQIFSALAYTHAACCWHRDIKPANILVNRNGDVRVADFGLSRYVDPVAVGQEAVQTAYVVTRWYRAPELSLARTYTSAVDLWSVGCVLGELLNGGAPLFPGRDVRHQVELTVAFVGTPTEAQTTHISSGRARRFLRDLPESPGVDLAARFPDAPPGALDLLRGLLAFDPSERLTAAKALRHPFVADFYDEADAAATAAACPPPDLSGLDEGVREEPLTADQVKRLLFREVMEVQPARAVAALAAHTAAAANMADVGRSPQAAAAATSAAAAAAAAAVAAAAESMPLIRQASLGPAQPPSSLVRRARSVGVRALHKTTRRHGGGGGSGNGGDNETGAAGLQPVGTDGKSRSIGRGADGATKPLAGRRRSRSREIGGGHGVSTVRGRGGGLSGCAARKAAGAGGEGVVTESSGGDGQAVVVRPPGGREEMALGPNAADDRISAYVCSGASSLVRSRSTNV
ncbi:hypothetical protein MMPV_000901 [Pyropia vietnamensis]